MSNTIGGYTVDVKRIENHFAKPFILEKHYARRRPSISYSFGLYVGGFFCGICTFGQPGGACLSKGLFGGEYRKNILELNRLFIDEFISKRRIKNLTSYFVSQCIKMLPKPTCIVSFSDTSFGHNGTIYKACNFIYTGLSAKRTEWVIKGMEHLHSKSIADKAKKGDGRWEALKAEYGDRLGKRERPRKHRYVYIHADKKDKKVMLEKLKYKPTKHEYTVKQKDYVVINGEVLTRPHTVRAVEEQSND